MAKLARLAMPEQVALLRRLFIENGLQYWRGYAIALAFMGVTASMTGLSAWIIKDVINEIFVEQNAAMVPVIAAAVAAIFVTKGVAGYFQQVILSRVGNAIVADIQMRLFDHLQRHRLDFFERFTLGQLNMRFSQSARAAREAINAVVTSMGRDLFTVIALVIVMLVQDPLLATLALLIGPPVAYGEWRLVKMIKEVARSELLSYAKMTSTLQQTAQGNRVVKAFRLEPVMRDDMEGAVEGVRNRANRIAQVTAMSNPMMESLGGLAIAGVIVYGGWRVIEGGGDPGAFFSFITAFLMAYEPAKRLARLNIRLNAALIGVNMLFNLLDTRPRITESPDAKELTVSAGTVRLNNIRFAYAGRRTPALEGLTLEAPGGKVTALVGPSGAGKSTVIALIERFFDPDRGVVSIDGQDLRNVTFDSLRRNIAHVGQDPFLFEGTVATNIGLGREGATRAEIEQAVRDANAENFVTALPQGLDTELGENGAQLSGGERQRLAIARAMLRDAPILLLDEPTSALDAEAEARVAEALERLMAGRTTIVIAHRLTTVRRADMIHVIEGGRVVETGRHGELRDGGGLYARLHELQFGA